jgi:aspartyl-tRNA(Asn)/glutamyl-tRNA(Gln) amidotransferase subunit A
MARTVEDCALLLEAIAGYDPVDPASARVPVTSFSAELSGNIQGVRIGVPRANWFDENKGTDAATEAVFNDALETLKGLGAVLIEIDGRAFAHARKANQTILVAEAYAYHEKRFQQEPAKFGSSVRRRMLEGAFLSAADYITAQRARTLLNEQIQAHFTRVDLFATPAAPRPPEPFDTLDPNEQNLRPNFTNPFNLTGLPAVSVPCGFTPDGLPVGLQIVAPPFAEASALRAAHAYEQATGWYKTRPLL